MLSKDFHLPFLTVILNYSCLSPCNPNIYQCYTDGAFLKVRFKQRSKSRFYILKFWLPHSGRLYATPRVSPDFSVSGSSDRAARGRGAQCQGSFISSVFPLQTIVGEVPCPAHLPTDFLQGKVFSYASSSTLYTSWSVGHSLGEPVNWGQFKTRLVTTKPVLHVTKISNMTAT